MILVTGASGFVASHLCEMLKERGIPVRGVSRHASDELIGIGEFLPNTDWGRVLEGVDAVVHLAARAHVRRETALDPLAEYRKVNVDAAVNLAEQAQRAGVRRFVFVSSIAVNGNATAPGSTFSEHSVANPHDDYGRSKFEAECAICDVLKPGKMEATIVRPPLVYGPKVPSNFRSMMYWVSKGIPLPFASISNRRSMVSVRNLCDFLILVAESPAAANHTNSLGG